MPNRKIYWDFFKFFRRVSEKSRIIINYNTSLPQWERFLHLRAKVFSHNFSSILTKNIAMQDYEISVLTCQMAMLRLCLQIDKLTGIHRVGICFEVTFISDFFWPQNILNENNNKIESSSKIYGSKHAAVPVITRTLSNLIRL